MWVRIWKWLLSLTTLLNIYSVATARLPMQLSVQWLLLPVWEGEWYEVSFTHNYFSSSCPWIFSVFTPHTAATVTDWKKKNLMLRYLMSEKMSHSYRGKKCTDLLKETSLKTVCSFHVCYLRDYSNFQVRTPFGGMFLLAILSHFSKCLLNF